MASTCCTRARRYGKWWFSRLERATVNGEQARRHLAAGSDAHVWQPWDSPPAVYRFFNHFKPRLGLLMETEIWPNLVAEAKARAMPLVVVNARLSLACSAT